MSKKEKILKMYFEEHKLQDVIAESVGITQSYISQVIKKDKRYLIEKENRHNESMNKKSEYNKEYYKTYNRPSKNDNSYEQLQEQLKQDSLELSYSNGTISDYDFAKWNISAYHRNSKGNLVLDRKLKCGFDVPKSININIKIPTQKYKHKCCHNYILL